MATQSGNSTSSSTENRASLDGERVRVTELNTDLPFASLSNTRDTRIRRWWRNFNLVLAGMYTGLTCYGTPHSQRPRDSGQDSDSQADKPDNRPI